MEGSVRNKLFQLGHKGQISYERVEFITTNNWRVVSWRFYAFGGENEVNISTKMFNYFSEFPVNVSKDFTLITPIV